MNVLLVGAGAVGQVYGRHFQLGGADVSFFVKPKYAEEARAGFDMYPLNRRRSKRWSPVRFEGFGVVTSMEEVAAQTWDAVILCVSSTALRAGRWLDELALAIGDATVVVMQPGIEDHDYVYERVPEAQVVSGLIGIVGYHAPMEGESVERPGIAYWFPPLTSFPFSGPAERARPLAATLKRGKMPTKVTADVKVTTAFGSAALNVHMGALELAGWRFAALRRDRALLPLAHRAARQGWGVASAVHGTKPPLLARMLRPTLIRMALRIASWAAPMNLETFFRVHFTKVADQTRMLIDTNRRRAAELGLPTDALTELLERLPPLDDDERKAA